MLLRCIDKPAAPHAVIVERLSADHEPTRALVCVQKMPQGRNRAIAQVWRALRPGS